MKFSHKSQTNWDRGAGDSTQACRSTRMSVWWVISKPGSCKYSECIEILSGLLSGPPWIFWGQTVRQSVIPKKGKIFGEKCVELACQHDLGEVCGQHSLGFRQNKLFIGCHQWFTVATFHWFWYCKVVVACTFWVYSLEHFRTMSTQNLS